MLVGPSRWFEQHVDFLSVQSTLCAGGATTFRQRMATHIEFFANNKKG